MRYARSLFLPTVSYITRRYLDVTTITAVNWQGAVPQTQPPAVASIHLTFNSVVPQSIKKPHFRHGTPTT